eukprot:TRINITY_DN78303_c0_g1_i1.p1 TRINITY_DN78303_c0_g1~~TRINITY_DN78303_c0_g1_i1.p1  ORF type:complete len:200 (+),score=13.35 TRINITY_DN78303_c0_g1_i1:106-705(+)
MAATTGDSKGVVFHESEVEFAAEDELVRVVPNFRADALRLFAGEFGPFRPQMAVEVPLWLAVALKKRGKCAVQPPTWMAADRLSAALDAEREQEGFQPLPFHYIEVAHLLFEAERHGVDIPDAYKVRSLLQDIRDVRFNKIHQGLKRLGGATNAVKLANLSAMEANLVRPFFCSALKEVMKREHAVVEEQEEADTRQEG